MSSWRSKNREQDPEDNPIDNWDSAALPDCVMKIVQRAVVVADVVTLARVVVGAVMMIWLVDVGTDAEVVVCVSSLSERMPRIRYHSERSLNGL